MTIEIREIDATGLACPLPVLRLQKALRDVRSGAGLRLLATDPMAAIDVPHFAAENGHTLVSTHTDETDLLIFEIRKA